jgi:hypothetical protein
MSRIRNLLLFAAAMLLALAWADYALGQTECMHPLAMEEMLLRQYGETPFAQGTRQDGAVFLFYGSRQQRSWTVVQIGPDGCARILGSGGNFTAPLAG